MSQQLPDPSTEAVKLWLKGLKHSDLESQAWIHVNQRFHGIAMGMRTHLARRYPDPAERAAAFDGLVVGLLTLSHFADISQLEHLFSKAEQPIHQSHSD
jgi:hypothetical protein